MPFRIADVPIDSVAVLAPMAGMTDLAFRRLCADQGCGLVYTELVNSKMLLQESRRALQNVETGPDERPVGVQLYGPEPALLAEAARWVEEHVPCDLIDLNMGCPVPKVVSKGSGAALMRDPGLVERLVRAVVDAVSLPVTAKTRSGWDDSEINAVAVGQAVEAAGGVALAVHARTRAQRHEGPVNWELLAEIKQTLSIPVIGNGGIETAEQALRMRETTGVDAVMIGRGSLGNPFLFRQIDDAWNGRPVREPTDAERRAVLLQHLRSTAGDFLRWSKRGRETDEAEGRAMRYLRGHLVRYVRGAPGEGAFKKRLNGLQTMEAVLDAVDTAWGWDDEVRDASTVLLAARDARATAAGAPA